jgi:hypothetical protein
MISLKNPTKSTKMLMYGLTAFVVLTIAVLFISKMDAGDAAIKYKHRVKAAAQLSMQINKATNTVWIRSACGILHNENTQNSAYAAKHGLTFFPSIGLKCNS